ncbi:fumarylacetoacetate hydrolase family protein [Rhizobium sp. P38BS-XIX]|uniref:fumarylacetoacetate hydrolase family protein n=1 Tax=Rhizobium sp. P38BS-XIX TaxID=2726740 RepID=UPI00145664BC|nr:fumarylacetoacetate hydrolase family protein [Rhizobium sp. P38BS-XIX]NLR97367.1 fumarylacetoacetate hydrolase family protein [Rhizobium sp. P38BS-XIX]
MQTKFGLMTIETQQGIETAIWVDGQVVPFSTFRALEAYKSLDDVLSAWDAAMEPLQRAAGEVAEGRCAHQVLDPDAIAIRAPHTPKQVFCTGANYRQHVVDIVTHRFADRYSKEGLSDDEIRAKIQDMMDERARSGTPYIFTRIQSSYAGPFDDITLPPFAEQPDWEAELALVFKRGGQNIDRRNAMDHVAGYLVVNDITSRDQIFTADPKDLGADWLHAKNSPGFFPMGPMIVPAQFVEDPHNLKIELKLNGKIMQDARTDDMIFDIPHQIEVLSKYARIMAGDLLATGSPSGNGTSHNRYLRPGDVMEVTIEGLGTQRSCCV